MKKRNLILMMSVCLVLLTTLSVVSAGWFTGKVTEIKDGDEINVYDGESREFEIGGNTYEIKAKISKNVVATDKYIVDIQKRESGSWMDLCIEKEVGDKCFMENVVIEIVLIDKQWWNGKYRARLKITIEEEVGEKATTISYSEKGVIVNAFMKEGMIEFPVLNKYNGNIVIGRDPYNMLRTSDNDIITFDSDTDDYFVASYDDGTNTESYLMRATSFAEQTASVGNNETTFQFYKSGAWSDAKTAVKPTKIVKLGNMEFNVQAIDRVSHKVTIEGGGSISFDKIYTEDGLIIDLPIENRKNVIISFK